MYSTLGFLHTGNGGMYRGGVIPDTPLLSTCGGSFFIIGLNSMQKVKSVSPKCMVYLL